MVYAIKLLLAVLLLCAVAVPLLRKPFAGLFTSREYTRAWWIIVGSALVCFLAGKPLFVMAGAAIVALIATSFFGSDPRGRLAAFWLLILLFPPVNLSLEGFAGINRFIVLSPARTLALLLLVPAALALAGDRRIKIPAAMRWLDALVISYPLLSVVTASPGTELTATIRSLVELVIDVLLPYYVTTRGIRSASDLKFISARMGLGLAYLALIGLLESVLRKNVYSELQGVYGVQWQLSHVLMRGPFLRVQATTPQPIIMAFAMIFGLCLWGWLRVPGATLVRQGRAIALVFLLALFATWSRGPLLGCFLLFLCLWTLRWMPPMRFLAVLTLFLVVGVVASATGTDQFAYDALKAVFGSSEADTSSIDYRRKLLESSVALIKQSPIWGVPNYAYYLQDLRQGEGIVDLVNTYVAVALGNGLIGLTLFLAPHLVIVRSLLKQTQLMESRTRLLGGSFPLAMVGLNVASLFIIFTTSDFSLIPTLMLFMVAVPGAWLAMSAEARDQVDLPDDTPAVRPAAAASLPAYVNRSAW